MAYYVSNNSFGLYSPFDDDYPANERGKHTIPLKELKDKDVHLIGDVSGVPFDTQNNGHDYISGAYNDSYGNSVSFYFYGDGRIDINYYRWGDRYGYASLNFSAIKIDGVVYPLKVKNL